MRLILASGNKNKLAEMRKICGKLGIEVITAADAGVDMDCEETGSTFEENARIKAEYVMRASGLPAVSDDSGLEVYTLDNRPGVYSARYGGEGLADNERTALLLRELEGVPAESRGARFVSCICCAMPDENLIEARGECFGTILFSPAGEGGFGYDPVFFYEDYGMSFAEMTSKQKNSVSHRGSSLELFEKRLSAYLKEVKL